MAVGNSGPHPKENRITLPQRARCGVSVFAAGNPAASPTGNFFLLLLRFVERKRKNPCNLPENLYNYLYACVLAVGQDVGCDGKKRKRRN